jgi:hypothetical protein
MMTVGSSASETKKTNPGLDLVSASEENMVSGSDENVVLVQDANQNMSPIKTKKKHIDKDNLADQGVINQKLKIN